MSCDPEAGSVKLDNGDVLDGFDLFIGADGIRSQSRTSVLGKEVNPVLTGVSIPSSALESDEEITKFLNPRDPCTTMIVGYDSRLIMGPARNGTIYSIVAMVPDKSVHEDSTNSNWKSKGDLESLLESFQAFPESYKRIFKHADEDWSLAASGLGRAILIGDPSHAMLPTQGQGASQSIEDAKALGAFFEHVKIKPSASDVQNILKEIEEVRKTRATLIQIYSRESANPATEKGDTKIKLKADQQMDFNCDYHGAKRGQVKQKEGLAHGPTGFQEGIGEYCKYRRIGEWENVI